MLVELHILQNVAPSNLNRDDANSPKDCEFGGHRRARISSQCIKRSIREDFQNIIPSFTGYRSKLVSEKLFEKLEDKISGKSPEEIKNLTKDIIEAYYSKFDKKADKTSVLVFFDESELEKIVEKVIQTYDPQQKDNKYLITAISKLKIRPYSYDIALFGRMLAEYPERNVDGTCQVAHAISTNRVSMEFDFFTAVDDLQKDDTSGAGMMGTIGFNSSCFYRYSVIHTDRLLENLENDKEGMQAAVKAFIKASFTAMPTGKQNSFAAYNPPSFAVATVREDNMPWSLANAFEKPIKPDNSHGLVASSVKALNNYWDSLSSIYKGNLKLKNAAVLVLPTPDLKEEDYPSLINYKKADLNEFISQIVSEL
ncbi:MAG: type I-E CRISPR-associated protein Cas7/Cse4/CasC [Ignavibacteriales bacterium]|nr:type I-E CRISPR-associated protein Cas7/Cse4/CasC [Ignavibacteriales bacterium]MCF8315325.1 type I-E CRISPR-associated protein Cas7/Cse4/CasC [Ignavibacteriales bacterium]MCF8436783.1 type I-E CRISPR-associated protein Cas7/Cse4/CasC [Ignavibacteriales bacterium]